MVLVFLLLTISSIVQPQIFGVLLMSQTQEQPSPAEFDKLWNYRDPAATEQKFRDLQSDVEALGDPDLTLQLQTQIARCQGLQRKFDDAHITLDDVRSRLTDATKTARIRYLLERGRTHNSSNEQTTAIPLFEEAWNLARATGEDFHAVDAAHMLGIACKDELANDWNRKAVEAAEASEDNRARGWLGALYNNIGWYYFEQKEYVTAEEWFVKTRDWYEEHSLQRGRDIARWSIAKAWRLQGRAQESLEQQQILLKEYKAAGRDNDGYVYEEIAECLLALDRAEESRPYFKRAHEVLSADQWLQANESERLERLLRLSRGDE